MESCYQCDSHDGDFYSTRYCDSQCGQLAHEHGQRGAIFYFAECPPPPLPPAIHLLKKIKNSASMDSAFM